MTKSKAATLDELDIKPGQHGFNVSSVALDIAGANNAQEFANVIGGMLDEAFNRGALHATRVNTYSRDGFDLLTADHVEFKSIDGKVWLNVDGKLTVRVGHASVVMVENSIKTPKIAADYPLAVIPAGDFPAPPTDIDKPYQPDDGRFEPK